MFDGNGKVGMQQKKEPKKYAFTAEEVLKIWALRIQGKRLTDPCTLATGGDMDAVDPERVVADYVQETELFFESERVLKWIHVFGHKADTFDPRQPGESLDFALGRLGWRKWIGVPAVELGPSIEKVFMLKLWMKCRDNPLYYFKQVEETVLPARTEPEDRKPLKLQKGTV